MKSFHYIYVNYMMTHAEVTIRREECISWTMVFHTGSLFLAPMSNFRQNLVFPELYIIYGSEIRSKDAFWVLIGSIIGTVWKMSCRLFCPRTGIATSDKVQ
jgi:hypothetical protein